MTMEFDLKRIATAMHHPHIDTVDKQWEVLFCLPPQIKLYEKKTGKEINRRELYTLKKGLWKLMRTSISQNYYFKIDGSDDSPLGYCANLLKHTSLSQWRKQFREILYKKPISERWALAILPDTIKVKETETGKILTRSDLFNYKQGTTVHNLFGSEGKDGGLEIMYDGHLLNNGKEY